MSHKIQVRPSLKHWHVFHKGLINILVSHQLCKLGKTWDNFIRNEGFEGMNISRTRGWPLKNPRDPIIANYQLAKPKCFPKPSKFTFIGKRKSQEPHEQRNPKREKSNPSSFEPNLKDSSPRRSAHNKRVNFAREFVPSSPENEVLEQDKMKQVKETQEAVMEESPSTPVHMSKKVKEASQPISEPLKKSVCKSTINKPKKKDVVDRSEIKTSPKLPAKVKAGGKTSELT
jgi:hypothetical protein